MKDKLKRYMQENGLTQRQLADLMNTDESYISKILSGKHKPGAVTVEKYYRLPGVQEKETVEELRRETNELWLAGVIDEKAARRLLAKMRNPQE